MNKPLFNVTLMAYHQVKCYIDLNVIFSMPRFTSTIVPNRWIPHRSVVKPSSFLLCLVYFGRWLATRIEPQQNKTKMASSRANAKTTLRQIKTFIYCPLYLSIITFFFYMLIYTKIKCTFRIASLHKS